ncbi:MAG: hypothetical protein IKR70_02895 [Lachnospiraceae bacterium]|nr:hypothetical protein [Lachnospiraceae bacterium]
MQCLIIYNEEDAEYNEWFINHIIECLEKYGIDAELLIREKIFFDGLTREIKYNGEARQLPDAIVNRTRDFTVSMFFEQAGVKVFNSTFVTMIGNDKYMAVDFVKNTGAPVPESFLLKKGTRFEQVIDKEMVVKSLHGHGGSEVYAVSSNDELEEIRKRTEDDMILQEKLIPSEEEYPLGKDLRVYIVGNKIVAGMMRSSDKDFRSNFSLGGRADIHDLTDKELAIVKKITDAVYIDHAAIDHIYDKGNPVFNEIEDMCGSRMLYENTDIDIADMYAKHIADTLKG